MRIYKRKDANDYEILTIVAECNYTRNGPEISKCSAVIVHVAFNETGMYSHRNLWQIKWNLNPVIPLDILQSLHVRCFKIVLGSRISIQGVCFLTNTKN